ncbi:MAG: glycosyl hydrolase family 28-related protein [Acutalibacteraceae bacterium]|jgi:hypothetical protein
MTRHRTGIIKRALATAVSLLLTAAPCVTPLGGISASAEVDTTPVVARFSGMEDTVAASGTICKDWTTLDGVTGSTDVDVSGHDLNKLELYLEIDLSSTDASSPQTFTSGAVEVRRTYTDGQENAATYGINQLQPRLQLGSNTVRIPFGSFNARVGTFDHTKLWQMRVLIYNSKQLTMTIRKAFLIDTTTLGGNTAAITAFIASVERVEPRVATPSSGMASMDRIVYVADATEFGADKTGVADSTAAIQTALNRVGSQQGGTVFLPAGRYKVLGTLNIPGGVNLRGEWIHPDEGGLGKGTILMAYAGRGTESPTDGAFITQNSGTTLRDISVWYPEQDPANPAAYPATIRGNGHTDTINVTLYNSYTGFYNNSCSSMLIRGIYGTALHLGIHGAYAYDIPRVERIAFDPAYWANSGLPGAPSGNTLSALNAYLENNFIGMSGGEQDWGYWFDLRFNHAKYGLFLTAVPDDNGQKMVPGNIAAGKLVTRNVKVGVYMENVGYPGFQLTHSDIQASEYGMYYAPYPSVYNEYKAQGISVSWSENATIAVTSTSFSGGNACFWSDKSGRYNLNFNDCTFQNWSQQAIYQSHGTLIASNCTFSTARTPLGFGAEVTQAVLTGNTFAVQPNDSRIVRGDEAVVPHTPDYDYTYVSDVKPATDAIFNVMDYGATAGTVNAVPSADSTAAFRAALTAAGNAGGGTVYVPGGVFRIEGTLNVPAGVELRGTFESAHFGNSTTAGSQLYVYNQPDNPDGTPLITLAAGSGVRGLSVFYPEQGYTDDPAFPDQQVHPYPPTIRADRDCWIQGMSMVACYTAIDAITNRCDNIVITDVTGAAMYATLLLGHGVDGGHVQNLHFNYSSWTHQGQYTKYTWSLPTPGTSAGDLQSDYTTRVVKGIVLGDVKNVDFFSCFNIIVAEQIVLEPDPYTGGDYEGVMWGVAFDAATNGVVGRAGSNADLTIIASMGVFNQQGGGYNVNTAPGFTGHVALYNADAWSDASHLALVAGGTVDFVQYFSWCVHRGVVKDGGTLNFLGSVMVSNNGDNSGTTPDFTFEEGGRGVVAGSLDCRDKLNIIEQPGSYVTKVYNGTELAGTSASSIPAERAVLADWLTTQKSHDRLTAYDPASFAAYDARFAAAQAVYDDPNATLLSIAEQITLLRNAEDALQKRPPVADAANRAALLAALEGERTGSGLDGYTTLSIQAYHQRFAAARAVYNDPEATNADVTAATASLQNADSLLQAFAGETITLFSGEKSSGVGHTMAVSQNSTANFGNRTYGRLRFDIKLSKDAATFPSSITADGFTDAQWASKLQNGFITVWVNGAGYNFGSLQFARGDLTGMTLGQYLTVELPLPQEAMAAGKIDQIRFMIYNDAHSLKDGYSINEEGSKGAILSVRNAKLIVGDVAAADQTALLDAIARAERVPTAYYTGASVSAMNTALNAATACRDDLTRTQAQVDAATTALNTAIDDLVPAADKSALLAAIEQALAVDLDLYPADRVAAFSAVLEEAREIWALSTATQTQIDNATTALGDAYGALGAEADKTALNAAIARAQGVNAAAYTTASVAAMNAALQSAITVRDDRWIGQSEVDAAAADLNAACNGLIARADKSALQTAASRAQAVDTSRYTTSTANALTTALNNALPLLANVDLTDQTAVNNAAAALGNAYNALAEKADLTALQAALTAARAIDLSSYTTASSAALTAAINGAQTVVNNAADTAQPAADAALSDLQSAQNALVAKADKSALQAAVNRANAIQTSGYTPATVATLQNAVAAAQSLLNDADASNQAAVDAAATAVNNAINGLVVKADKTVLNAAIARAQALDLSAYGGQSVQDLQTALTAAVAARDDANAAQATVDAAAAALSSAIEQLTPTVRVTFLGKYGEVVAVKAVNSAAELETALTTTTATALGGYHFVAWSESPDDAPILYDMAAIDEQTITVTPIYTQEGADRYTVTVTDAAVQNIPGFVSGETELTFDSRVTVKAQNVTYWLLDGAKVGFGRDSYTFYVSGQNTIRPVTGGTLPASPQVVLQQVQWGQGSEKYTLTVISQTSIPTGEVGEYGVIFTASREVLEQLRAGETVPANKIARVVSTKTAPNQQYMSHLLNVKPDKQRYAMAYAVVNGVTVYSDEYAHFVTAANGVTAQKLLFAADEPEPEDPDGPIGSSDGADDPWDD